jgi:hypothetical protein
VTEAFVLHDLGAEEAGEPWRAVVPAGWLAPDLPGHGDTPAPRHGAYDPLGPVTLARWALDGRGVVVGVGENAHGALILGAGGGCERVAIVDGLWGGWPSPEEQIAEMYASLRRVFEDAGAIAAPPANGLDPRARHGYGVHVSPDFCRRFWGAVTVPVLAVETSRSTTPPDERVERVSWFGGPAELVELPSDDPAAVVAAVLSWAG